MRMIITIVFTLLFSNVFCLINKSKFTSIDKQNFFKTSQTMINTDITISNISVLNINEIQKDEPQQLGNNSATKTTTDPTPKPGKIMTHAESVASYNRDMARAKAYASNLPKKFAEARNPALAYGDYEFDSKATNFERFKNSPCYSKLGFDPIKAMNDSVGLEKEYQVCEKEHRIKRNTKIFIYFFTAFVLFIITMVLFKKYYKKRIH